MAPSTCPAVASLPPPTQPLWRSGWQARGSDSSGTGSIDRPFASIAKGVSAAAAKPAGSRAVTLRNGTYYLAATVQIPATAHGTPPQPRAKSRPQPPRPNKRLVDSQGCR